MLRWEGAGDGDVVLEAERLVKQWKRQQGLPDALVEGSGRTETIPRSLVALEELVGMCQEALDRVNAQRRQAAS